MSPFCFIVRILMCRISCFTDRCCKVVLEYSRHTQRKSLPQRVERHVVHDVVYTDVGWEPGVQVEHMWNLAISLRLRNLYILLFDSYCSIVSLFLCCCSFLLLHPFCYRIFV